MAVRRLAKALIIPRIMMSKTSWKPCSMMEKLEDLLSIVQTMIESLQTVKLRYTSYRVRPIVDCEKRDSLTSVYAADCAMILYKKALELIHNAFYHDQSTEIHETRDQNRLVLVKVFLRVSEHVQKSPKGHLFSNSTIPLSAF